MVHVKELLRRMDLNSNTRGLLNEKHRDTKAEYSAVLTAEAVTYESEYSGRPSINYSHQD